MLPNGIARRARGVPPYRLAVSCHGLTATGIIVGQFMAHIETMIIVDRLARPLKVANDDSETGATVPLTTRASSMGLPA
jgi:xanthine dehydrogenase iron-sulfur cluster and FAD-binding subunit A